MIENKGISIWFFIGCQLLIYGIIITAANISEAAFHTFGKHVVLGDLHFGIWWGALLVVLGIVYVLQFRPGKKK